MQRQSVAKKQSKYLFVQLMQITSRKNGPLLERLCWLRWSSTSTQLRAISADNALDDKGKKN